MSLLSVPYGIVLPPGYYASAASTPVTSIPCDWMQDTPTQKIQAVRINAPVPDCKCGHLVHPRGTGNGGKCNRCPCRESEEAEPGKAPGADDDYYQNSKDGLGR